MEKVGNPLPMPECKVRNDGTVVVEFTQNGECVGELNFTKIIGGIFEALGIMDSSRRLKLVP